MHNHWHCLLACKHVIWVIQFKGLMRRLFCARVCVCVCVQGISRVLLLQGRLWELKSRIRVVMSKDPDYLIKTFSQEPDWPTKSTRPRQAHFLWPLLAHITAYAICQYEVMQSIPWCSSLIQTSRQINTLLAEFSHRLENVFKITDGREGNTSTISSIKLTQNNFKL